MSNILIYPRNPRPRPMEAEEPFDRFLGLGWLIAAVGLLCMLSATALTAVTFT